MCSCVYVCLAVIKCDQVLLLCMFRSDKCVQVFCTCVLVWPSFLVF